MVTFNTDALHERAMGYLPLSIGTALALQGLFGMETDDEQRLERRTPKPPIERITDVWINLNTVYRNLVNAIAQNQHLLIPDAALAQELFVEIERIFQVLHDAAPRVKVQLYYCDRLAIERDYPHARLRKPSTDLQRSNEALREKVLDILLRATDDPNWNYPFTRYKSEIRAQHDLAPRAAILTHSAIDLLARRFFGDLVLVESHTGAIKPRNLWYTKFHNGRTLERIPFLISMLQVFGDSDTFSPQPMGLRRALLELAQTHNWSTLTTLDKIRANVNQLTDVQVKEDLQKFLR